MELLWSWKSKKFVKFNSILLSQYVEISSKSRQSSGSGSVSVKAEYLMMIGQWIGPRVGQGNQTKKGGQNKALVLTWRGSPSLPACLSVTRTAQFVMHAIVNCIEAGGACVMKFATIYGTRAAFSLQIYIYIFPTMPPPPLTSPKPPDQLPPSRPKFKCDILYAA